MNDQEPRDADQGDELEADIMQADHAFGAESAGTTVEEELAGESLDERLAAERPERPSIDEALSVVDEGLSDDEAELVGEAVIERDEFASPEEAALSVRDIAPGATDHDDPHPPTRPDLLAEEERLWTELHVLVNSLPDDKVEEPGYFAEGWSAKDLVAHIGCWLAEAGIILERIRFGTYRPEEIDIDAMNKTFYDAMHDIPFPDVRAQGVAARYRMLRAWRSLPEPSPEADRWISKAGPEHYAEHLPRLREWVGEIGP